VIELNAPDTPTNVDSFFGLGFASGPITISKREYKWISLPARRCKPQQH